MWGHGEGLTVCIMHSIGVIFAFGELKISHMLFRRRQARADPSKAILCCRCSPVANDNILLLAWGSLKGEMSCLSFDGATFLVAPSSLDAPEPPLGTAMAQGSTVNLACRDAAVLLSLGQVTVRGAVPHSPKLPMEICNVLIMTRCLKEIAAGSPRSMRSDD